MLPFPENPSISLLPEGAVFLIESRTLVVADVHLGKSATFRARGLPVPEGDTGRDLARLTALAEKYAAAHLVIAGDLFHAPAGITPELEEELDRFLTTISMPVTLVMGNHDAKIKRLPAGLDPLPHLDLGDTLRILHDPAHADGDRLHISGHWHPIVKIPDGKRTSLRLPCFLFRNNTLVLPAFGSFTGGAVMSSEPGDRYFVELRGKVVEIPPDIFR